MAASGCCSAIQDAAHLVLVTTDESRGDSRVVDSPPGDRSMVHHAYLSPDGKWVLIVEMDNRGIIQPCRVVPFDGSAPPRIVGPSATCLTGAWSPDGKFVYVTAETDAYHIWRQAFPDGKPEQITLGPTSQVGVAVASDGKSAITAVGNDDSTIWLHDKDGDRQLSTNGSADSPLFSADGKTLYFLVANGQSLKHELWKRDLAGGDQENVLPGYSMQSYSVSRDGKLVAFSVTNRDGHASIWVAPADRSASPVKLTPSGGNEDTPHFLPNDDLIFRLIERDHNYVYRMKMDGSGREKVSDEPVLDLVNVSPDGRWVVAASAPSSRNEAFGTRAIPVSGGLPILLCHSYCWTLWDSSGKSFFLNSEDIYNGTYILPVKRDTSLPKLPDTGFSNADDFKKAKPVGETSSKVAAAATSTSYASVRRNTRRNLYRIPLP